jgi:hypothetical protein
MRRYLGRTIGAALGALAGVPGILFGVLAGSLVDQYRNAGPTLYRLDRFIRRPDLESHRATARRYTAVTLTAFLAGPEGYPSLAGFIDGLAAIPEGGEHCEPLLRRAMEYSGQIDPDRICRNAQRIFPESAGGTDHLLDTLVSVVLPEGELPSPEITSRFRRTGELLGASASALQRLEKRLSCLDVHSCLVLGIAPEANREDIRRAYRRLAADLHPDTASNLDQIQQIQLRDAFLRVREAYDTLSAQLEARDGAVTPPR